MKYWILAAILLFVVCYAVANRDKLIVEHLTATAGPMDGGKGPTPADATPAAKKAGAAIPETLTPEQKKQCDDLKTAKDSTNPLQKAVYQAVVDQGKLPEYCKSIVGDLSDVGALASKLTALQQEVSDMKQQAKDQVSQASAAQASLQAMT
jgi:hypothetical protein